MILAGAGTVDDCGMAKNNYIPQVDSSWKNFKMPLEIVFFMSLTEDITQASRVPTSNIVKCMRRGIYHKECFSLITTTTRDYVKDT